MAMDDLLRIANRTEDLPDTTLAQLAQAGGIEGVIAASELKSRNDIREDAQMLRMRQQPPVVDQLINMAARTRMMPAAPVAPAAQAAPMAPAAPMASDMAALMQQGGVPMMQSGGLVRRFQSGSLNQGTLGLNPQFVDALTQFAGYNPYELLDDPDVQVPAGFSLNRQQLDALQQQYEDAMAGTRIYTPDVEAAAQAYKEEIFVPNPVANPILSQLGLDTAGVSIPNPLTKQQTMDNALQAARQRAVSGLLQQSGVPQGQISALTPVGSQTPVSAFVPQGQRLNVLPQGYSAMAQSPTTGTTAQTGTSGQLAFPGQTLASLTPTLLSSSTTGGAPSVGTQQSTTGTSGSGVQTFTTPAVARTATFDALRVPAAQISTDVQLYENSPQYRADQAALRTLQSQSITTKTQGLRDEYLQNLMKREEELANEVTTASNKLKDLEEKLPDRQNIKDRIKKQTSLGMAQAFFQAAAGESPNFITALSQGLGGAAGVLNKMTGQEQKELYQHALNEFARERERANTAYKRQQDVADKLNAAQQFEITVSNANRQTAATREAMLRSEFYKAQELRQNAEKFNAEQKYAALDNDANRISELQQMIANSDKARNDMIRVANDVNVELKMESDQFILRNDVDTGRIYTYNPGALRGINNSLNGLIKELARGYKDVTATITDPAQRMDQARKALRNKLQSEARYGDLAVLDEYAPDLATIASSSDPNAALIAFKQTPKGAYLNPKALGYQIPDL